MWVYYTSILKQRVCFSLILLRQLPWAGYHLKVWAHHGILLVKGVRIMKRLELLAMLYSLEALLEEGKADKANEVIKKVIAEAENTRP